MAHKSKEIVQGEPVIIQITNDSYYFIAHMQPMLDDSNMEEVEEINEQYKYGFSFSGEAIPVEDSDLVEVTIIPNILSEVETPYTHFIAQFNDWVLEFYYSDDKSNITMRYYNTKTHESFGHQTCAVETNKFNRKQFRTAKGSIFPLSAGVLPYDPPF